MSINPWTPEQIRKVLHNKKGDIVTKVRALFYARYYDTKEALDLLVGGLEFSNSVVLRHEIAYVIGQMSVPDALPALINLLDDVKEHPMVRHEAAEGIHALGVTSEEAMNALRRHLQDSNQAVKESCELAVIGMQRLQAKEQKSGTPYKKPAKSLNTGFYLFTTKKRDTEEQVDKSSFSTYDPSEGDASMEAPEHIPALQKVLANETSSLWDRYVALYTLRNINTAQAAFAISEALSEKKSAILRHQICFVLGQMQIRKPLPAVASRLDDKNEASMVRHEAAFALGSLGSDTSNDEGKEARRAAIDCLTRHVYDSDPIVAESCIVGLWNIERETGCGNMQSYVTYC